MPVNARGSKHWNPYTVFPSRVGRKWANPPGSPPTAWTTIVCCSSKARIACVSVAASPHRLVQARPSRRVVEQGGIHRYAHVRKPPAGNERHVAIANGYAALLG